MKGLGTRRSQMLSTTLCQQGVICGALRIEIERCHNRWAIRRKVKFRYPYENTQSILSHLPPERGKAASRHKIDITGIKKQSRERLVKVTN